MAEWLNDMNNELQGIEESPEAEIHLDSLNVKLKKVANWKAPENDGFWF